MNAQHQRERRPRALASLVLMAACTPTLSAMAPQPRFLSTTIELALDRLQPKLGEHERTRLAELFAGSEALVGYLPMGDLRRITFGEGWLELGFDFGKDDSKELKIPSTKKHYWDAKKKKVVATKSEAETIRLKSRVRFFLDENGIQGLRQGDLSVYRYFAWRDLSARIVHQRQIERDSHGNPRVRTDARGRAVLVEDEPVLHECDHWLVLEAKGRRVEVSLD